MHKLLSILREDKQPLRRLIAAFLRNSRLGQLIKFRVQDYYLRFYPSGISSLYWYNPHARSEDYELITAVLKPGEICIDVGANIGTTVIPSAKSVGESGKVIAFEPHPVTFNYLKNNIALNHLTNVELYNCALGNEKGSISFTSQYTDETNHVLTSAQDGIKVPITLLDEVCSELNQIALLKLDVEGYEKFVLAGGQKTLAKTDCVYCEFCEDNFQVIGYSGKEVLSQLKQFGFELFRRNYPEHQLISVDCEYLPMQKCENIIAIKNVESFLEKTQWQVEEKWFYRT